MSEIPGTPWHRASWEHLLKEGLPELLRSRLPGLACSTEPDGADACRFTASLGGATCFCTLPVPDTDGVFAFLGRRLVVPPRADSDDLEQATVRCAGELFCDYLAEHLGDADADGQWDDAALGEWLALDARLGGFMQDFGQRLDDTNWLSVHTHLRRIVLPDRRRMFAPAHVGRVCPFETPEGPNIGQVLTIARGAEIRDGRVAVVDDSPAAGLGLSASMIPFLEHSDCCRELMACNMMRQWITPPDPEPAIVRTGNEPDDPSFWCGRNLLTAYIDRGIDTWEDSILVSETCARRLGYPEPIACGDKLCNRSGNKGTVSRIAPDDEMPHLADGRAVDLVFSPIGLYSRLTYGQLREAVISWAARRAGRPAIVPPFQAPTTADLQERGVVAGLHSDGMVPLLECKDGDPLPLPATVGHVYWGRLDHRAAPKLRVAMAPGDRGQKVGEAELHALRLAGAPEVARELFNTLSQGRPDAGQTAARVAAGPIAPAAAPSPLFAALQCRLQAAGIAASVSGDGVSHAWAPPTGEVLRLAEPVAHPWRPQTTVAEVGLVPNVRGQADLVEANERLAALASSASPGSLLAQARSELARRLAAYFDALVGSTELRFRSRVLFTGRAVTSPAGDLRHDQIGLPEEMAWRLFAPMLMREFGDAGSIAARTEAAARALDELMARTWVLVHRMPTMGPANFLAFRPVRAPGSVIRLHPMANMPLNADFDGDQLAIFLPVTDAAQREAAERLTFAAHIERDRAAGRCSRPLYDGMFGPIARQMHPKQGARFGLAWLALTPEGHAEVERVAGVPVPLEGGVLTTSSMNAAVEALIETQGIPAMLNAMDRLWKLGFEMASLTGASLSAFPESHVEAPEPPAGDNVDAWNAYVDEYLGRVSAWLADPASGADPARITMRSGARAGARFWLTATGAKGVVVDAEGKLVPIRSCQAYGMTAQEALTCCVGMRDGLARAVTTCMDPLHELCEADLVPAYGVLARARRAKRPGIVFARAAAAGEVDPLADFVSRLFVGIV